MARMIPAFCPKTAPPGEELLYKAFKEDEATKDWVILHSLGIADHIRQVEGEADFIIVAPKLGLLIIEVKSHLSIKREFDGRWHLGSQKPTSRSPFQQADEAMHSIRHYLLTHKVDLQSIAVLSAVWFTGVRARASLPSNPEWHDWQVLDSEDLRKGVRAAVLRTFAAGQEHLRAKIKGFAKTDIVSFNSTAAERIVRKLRPRFDLCQTNADLRRTRQAQLASFLDEQYVALDGMDDYEACLFTGPAGSGKTFLAMEAFCRQMREGRQGRLICFNKLLGVQTRQTLPSAISAEVGTFHQVLLRLTGWQVPARASDDFWNRELPEQAMAVLLEHPELALEFLIVDEIQDLAKPEYLDVLDLMVQGGLREGRVLLFGDFERQALYGTEDGRDLLRSWIPDLGRFKLTINCRNLPRIGYQVNVLGKLVPGYKKFRRDDDGIDPKFLVYSDREKQAALLIESIKELRSEGFELDEIVVLSSRSRQPVAESVQVRAALQTLTLADGRAGRKGQLLYSSIHAFKGLEAPAVVLTDLERSSSSNFDALLYVGLTRATDRLIAIIEMDTLRNTLGGSE